MIECCFDDFKKGSPKHQLLCNACALSESKCLIVICKRNRENDDHFSSAVHITESHGASGVVDISQQNILQSIYADMTHCRLKETIKY